jgi:hypothetical protein
MDMAEEKKIRVKAGGRQKNTPNKITSVTRQTISEFIAEYQNSGLMFKDFKSLEPRDRLMVAEKFLNYTIPKMQAQALEVSVNGGNKTIEDTLVALSDEMQASGTKKK